MSKIIKFKGCKRCGGDLFLERDTAGLYISCLQCGAILAKQKPHQEIVPELKPKKVLTH